MNNGFEVVLIILIVTILLVALALLNARQSAPKRARAASRQEALFELGFTPLDPSPQALVERIAALQPQRSRDQVALRDVYERPVTGGRAYLFDSIDADNDGPSWLGSGSLAIISRSLGCPAIVVLPRPQAQSPLGQGPLGPMVSGLLDRAYALITEHSGMVRTSFPDDIEFDERFAVLGADARAVEAFLTPQRRTALLTLPPDVVVAARQDTLMLSAFATPGAGTSDIDQVQSRREFGETLLDAFAARSPSESP